MNPSAPPIVLCFSGHDPTGGAGIHADIEAIAAAGCHAASAITCNTIQNTHNVQQLLPLTAKLFRQQAVAVLDDLPVAAIKIGLIGDAKICREITALLRDHPEIPAILDPVLAAGGGTELAGSELLESIRQELLPHIELATPNSIESRRIAERDNLHESAATILDMGCRNLLITGTHETSDQVINTLYQGSAENRQSWEWPRLTDSYHGSGCTLASAIAARIALGLSLAEAVEQAQDYTWQSLHQANKFGNGQALPNRLGRR
ncbi:MAG: hydroxymethylpyrimidine/phosphomethylpyrimidine kinase [Gammaproteobacteria bacterium]|nr:hydroxymethylpyrimidine/phosphomethylpyrimidine kinase [Gammaproteobacteria bacterium]